MSVTVTARIDEAIAEKLAWIAKQEKRSKSFLVARAIEDFVKSEASFLEAVQEGIDSANRGELTPHKEVMREMRDFIDSYEAGTRKANAAE